MTSREYTILIVDDSIEDRATYCRYLSSKLMVSYQIIETKSGESGLEQMSSIQPDLILLDYLLPDCNGLEFIQKLKQIAKLPPIIMLTEEGNVGVAVKAMKNGVEDYLIKGQLTPEILAASVRNALQQNDLQDLSTKSFQQQQLIAETALQIRKSLDLSEILDIAVREVQLLLNCDRVIIYQFDPDMIGKVVAESIQPGWTKSLGKVIFDNYFRDDGAVRYKQGKSLVVNNIHEWGISPCLIELLEKFQIKAQIISPLLLASSPEEKDSRLWGLLIAHQCNDYRSWEIDEVELLDKLAVQLAIPLQQAELVSSLQRELDTRKRLETELAQRVQVLEASEDYILLTDTKGQVIWHNPQMKEIVSSAETADLTQPSIAQYYPQWALNIIQEQGIPTAISKGTWLGETALLTCDDQEIPVSQLIIAHKSSNGKVEFISTVMRDLSLQKETEKSLEEKALKLKWLNQELLKITSLLKKRNQELDRFAYVTSHDLKAPLRAIANLATWLSEDLTGQIPDENQQQLQLMQSRIKRMDGLIQGLLTYSRVGRAKTTVRDVEVRDIVRDAINSVDPPPEFEIIVAPNLPKLRTEAVLLEQVFSNLISNAVKYHDQLNGKITVSVTESVTEQAEFYEFAVADNGIGIEPQYQDRIFTIFQTLQARDTIESTGIGLSIVKKIVEGQGGEIRVESELGKGSTFYFTWHK